ncbi:MAG: aromatic ring-hydroxylating dioxygenase subunit alpha [Caulobacterales bacterium]
MTEEAAKAAYAGVSEALSSATALPRAAYADASVFEAEMARVLRAGWMPVARESELAAPGDYRTADVAGAPLLVVRDEQGDIQVLSRVCRHRGMPIVEGSGNAKGFTCPYHLWRYGLNGRLAAAPGMERSARFEREACALPRIAAERWGGWVFANLDGEAAPLAPGLAALEQRLAAIGPARFVTADTITLDSPWNWKVMVENFLESYHHIGPHAGTLQKSNPGLGTHEGESGEVFTVLENPGADDAHAPFVVAAIFPATLMFFTEGPDPVGVWYELDRIEHAAFRLRIHLLASPRMAAVAQFVAAYREQVMAVHLEDIPACEGIQRGVTSPLYRPGPLSHLEGCLWRFHRFLQARVREGT